MCTCICFEVPGRKKKNRKVAETRSCVSGMAARDDAVASDVKLSSLSAVDIGKLLTLSPFDAGCSDELSLASDVTPSSSNSTIVSVDTVDSEIVSSEVIADSKVKMTLGVCTDRNNNAAGKSSLLFV